MPPPNAQRAAVDPIAHHPAAWTATQNRLARWLVVLLAAGVWTALPAPAQSQDLAPSPDTNRPLNGALVEANSATEADLDSLRGLGPATTARLLQARAQRPFHNWADLMQRTPGVGPRTAQRLSAQGLRVNGQTAPQ